MTTTLLRGLEQELADDFGSRIRDVTHRARFIFRRTPQADDFAAADIADKLALAARSTASFPAAFEPSFCPVGETTDDPFRPNMEHIASFTASRYVIDGGVLENSPIDLALDRIFRQRAAGPVRRVLAFVVPDPGTTARNREGKADPADKVDDAPEVLNVGLASMVEIPAAQSISSQVQQLRDHNDQVRARRRARVLLTAHNRPEAIDGLAETLFATYRAQRISDAIDYIVSEISKALVLKGDYGLGPRGRREWLRQTIVDLAPQLPFVPTASPLSPAAAAEQSMEGWHWGTRGVEHPARLLLDIVIRVERVSTLLSLPYALDAQWNAAYDILEAIGSVRDQDRQYWRGQANKVTSLLGEGKTMSFDEKRTREWVVDAFEKWQSTEYRTAGELLHKIADQLLGLRETVSALTAVAANSLDALVRDQARDLGALFRYFVRDERDARPAVVARLLAFETVQDALGGRGMVPEQEVEFIEISARSLSTFGGPEEPAQKIAGIQLGHFGAFYKSSWRANDWMWGRIDAVHRLVRILMDPERLRMAARAYPAGERAGVIAAEIRRIATTTDEPALVEELRKLCAGPAELEEELAYLDDDAMIVPEKLPRAVEAFSRRLEGEILSKELPRLASAVDVDRADGCFVSEPAAAFAASCRNATAGGVVRADQLHSLLSSCEIGKERLEKEVGTDRLSTIASQTVALAVSSMRTESGLLAVVGKLTDFIRAPALLFYVFARDVQYRSRTGCAINAATFAAGIVILATEILANQPYGPWFVLLGIAAIIAPMLLAALRWPGAANKIVGVLVGVALLTAAAVLLHVRPLPDLSLQTWQDIAAASLGALALALFFWLWPVRRKRSSPARGSRAPKRFQTQGPSDA